MGEINPKAIYGFAEARKLVGFGETFFRTEIAAGRLPAKRAGKRLIKIKGEDLQKWFDALPSASKAIDLCGQDLSTDGKQGGQSQTAETRALTSALATMNRSR